MLRAAAFGLVQVVGAGGDAHTQGEMRTHRGTDGLHR